MKPVYRYNWKSQQWEEDDMLAYDSQRHGFIIRQIHFFERDSSQPLLISGISPTDWDLGTSLYEIQCGPYNTGKIH